MENLIDDDLLDDKELTKRFLKRDAQAHRVHLAHRGGACRWSPARIQEVAAPKVKPFRLRPCVSDVLERLESVIHNQQATIVKIDMPDIDLTLAGDRFY